MGLWLQGQKSVSDAASTELEQRDGLPVFQEGKGIGWRHTSQGKAGCVSAGPGACRQSLSPGGVADAPGNSLWCNATTYGEIARKNGGAHG